MRSRDDGDENANADNLQLRDFHEGDVMFAEHLIPHNGRELMGRDRSYTILDNISEWRRGCTCGGAQALDGRKDHPGDCVECTEALIASIERSLRKSWLRKMVSRWL